MVQHDRTVVKECDEFAGDAELDRARGHQRAGIRAAVERDAPQRNPVERVMVVGSGPRFVSGLHGPFAQYSSRTDPPLRMAPDVRRLGRRVSGRRCHPLNARRM